MVDPRVTNLKPWSEREPVVDLKTGLPTRQYKLYLDDIYSRLGAATGDLIYDAYDGAQDSAAMTPALQSMIETAKEEAVSAAISYLVEQIDEIRSDPSALIDGNATYAPFESDASMFEPNVGAIVQQAAAAAPVQSVFGRTGAIVATEADYTLTLLGDVTITAPASPEVLRYNGAGWVNALLSVSTDVTGVLPVLNGGTGLSAPGSSGNVLTSNGAAWVSSAPAAVSTAPTYDRIVATAGQTVFNTANTVTANGGGKAYTMVTKNGLVLSEGGVNDYTITDANQVTLVVAASLNDVLTFRTWS